MATLTAGQKLRRQRIADGKCTACGKRAPVKDKTECKECRDYFKAWAAKKAKAAGKAPKAKRAKKAKGKAKAKRARKAPAAATAQESSAAA